MKTFRYTITDEIGIHARPAGLLAREAKKFASAITISVGEKQADATKLMAVMALGVKCGCEVEVRAEGADEDEAIRAMTELFEQNL
ncbi:MAG: HPr family phosphocarrier protein [Lachnospiraceae bacterium]|nr:HPr family phosphocarrier protein [Lachnospiraceae bacterium]